MPGQFDFKSGPLVTVLINTYNRPVYLCQALQSIFDQTYQNFEIILTRDGGLPVRDAIREFLNDRRLIFVDRDENRGLPYSFNQALKRAKGEYICYLGDDDIFYPFHIEVLLKAMLSQDKCQVVYSDLYKTHCRVLDNGQRQVLAKNLEVSRDFDRMLMLQFNHALHVSLMHKKDLINKSGQYNEDLNVLIDWDLTHRLSFYSDFLHIPVVTGEYYAPVENCDRISVQQRKNFHKYLENLLTIRNTRPPKPWPCMNDLSVIVLADKSDERLHKTVNHLWTHGYYPKQIYVPLPECEADKFDYAMPNVMVIPAADNMSDNQKIDTVLAQCDGNYLALVSADLPIADDEISVLERSLYPLIQKQEPDTIYEVVESTLSCFSAVISRDNLVQLRCQYPDLSIYDAACASGMKLKKPEPSDYPFNFDNLLTAAGQLEEQGNFSRATQVYEHLAKYCGNVQWMQTLQANAMYNQGCIADAGDLMHSLNQSQPTISRLMLEARANASKEQWTEAIEYYSRAKEILDGTSFGYTPEQIELQEMLA